VAALGEALLAVTQDAALRERLAGKVRAMQFGDQSWLSIAKKTMETYEGVLTPPSPLGGGTR